MIVLHPKSCTQLLKLLTFLCFSGLLQPTYLSAQSMVSTVPQYKNFLIEKGTGHVCGSCPTITLKCDTVIDSHPGRGMLLEYHFGPDAVPQAPPVDADFTTPYGDTIYDPAKLGWLFYLNMMVNRRDQGVPYGSTFIFGSTNQVQTEADAIVLQLSPVNLAMSSTFNSTTRLLTVNVEAYYTASSATSMNYLQIALTEDSIIATQYDPAYPLAGHFNPNFNHMNTFRANINGFAGDTVTHTSMGTMISRTYTYTIPTSYKNIPCNPQHCNLTLYMAEEKATSGIQSFTGKIMNAIRTKVGGSTAAVATIDAHCSEVVYPNPSNGMVYISNIINNSYAIDITDVCGKHIYTSTGNNTQNIKIDLSRYPKGIYLIKISTDKGTSTHKITLTD